METKSLISFQYNRFIRSFKVSFSTRERKKNISMGRLDDTQTTLDVADHTDPESTVLYTDVSSVAYQSPT